MMLIVTLTDCPIGLRGDLTKWLVEIQAGVFVGNTSARVREHLWGRIREICKNGRAVMVYGTNTEQRLDFRVLGNTWEPIDFDGIKLMLRPSPSRLKKQSALKAGFSKAAKDLVTKRVGAKPDLPRNYVIVDLKTTGLDPDTDEIIKIMALRVEGNGASTGFDAEIRSENLVEAKTSQGMGITEQMLRKKGQDLASAFSQFLEFTGKLPIVSHNVNFDCAFLRSASAKCGLPLFANRCIDTLVLSKRVVRDVSNFKLSTLAAHFNLSYIEFSPGANDCQITQQLYEKLINLLEAK